jgi:hypothetical protein
LDKNLENLKISTNENIAKLSKDYQTILDLSAEQQIELSP